MTNFIVGQGVATAGEHVYLHVDELPDDKFEELLAETQAEADKRRLLEEGAAQVAVAHSAVVTPELLVATLDESGAWYTEVAGVLNEGRKGKSRIPIVPEDELPGRAEAWMDEDRLQAIKEGLYYDDEHPVLLLAVPNAAVSHEDIVRTWANARNSSKEDNAWWWSYRDLKPWTDDELSGYDRRNKSPVRFTAIETGYPTDRAGTCDEQLAGLRDVQANHPAVRSANLLDGGMLAHRYRDQVRPNWSDTHVLQIDLEPKKAHPYTSESFPRGAVFEEGKASVATSSAKLRYVSRRAVA